jgi:hypothetical protein
MGNAATMVANVVIKIGLNLLGHDSLTAISNPRSDLRRSRITSTRIIEFFITSPARSTIPIMLMRFRVSPDIHKTARAPVTPKGTATSTVSG